MTESPDSADEKDGDSEWRFSVADLDDEGGEASDGGDGEGVFGTFGPGDTIEPGDIDPENALFVALGALLVVAGVMLLVP